MPEYKITYEDWVTMASTIKEFNDQMKTEERRREYINNWVDEVRTAREARPIPWIGTEYRNLSSLDDFGWYPVAVSEDKVEDERPAWETL